MKVLYIIDSITQGGAIRSFMEMVKAMKSLGITPVVLSSKFDNINVFLNDNEIENYAIGHPNLLRVINKKGWKGPLRIIKYSLLYYLAEWRSHRKLERIDLSEIGLIHTNSARNDIGCYLNKKKGIPHIMHIREFADADFDCSPIKPDYVDIFNNYTTQFISISEAVKKHWINKGIIADKITTIYNGIHFENITVSRDEDKYASFKMFIAGGVYPTKGQHLIVEAIGLLPENIREGVCLDVAGWYSKKYVDDMKVYASERGYEQQIRFLGAINDVHERLGNYQVGLMCSRAEGFGRTTAEYMHAQLGVIASDSGANPELIEDGVTGLLFKSGDAQSLAECIERLYNNRELLIKLSHAARKKARLLYTQQKNAESIYNLYQEILNHNNHV